MSDLSSLEKGLAIISELAAADRVLTIPEVAAEAKLNRSTTYRLCEILERDGWVRRDEGDDGVARLDLGPTMHGLAVLIGSKYDVDAKLRPIIDGLSRSLNETVHVGVLDHAQLINVARALPADGLNMAARIGSREPAHTTSLGKALLATLDAESLSALYLDEELPARTPKTISSRGALFAELDRIRAQGYAIDNEESCVGVFCVGVPVFDRGDRASLAISVTSMPGRIDGDRFKQVVEAVRSAARLATVALGGVTPDSWSRPATPADGLEAALRN